MSVRGSSLASLLLGAATFALLTSGLRATQHPKPATLHARGECASCHERAPTYHDRERWDLNHGRVGQAIAERCQSCHTSASCEQCHSQAPPSHTSQFLRPQDDSDAAQLHVFVGRTRPGSCLSCHEDSVSDCATCHDVMEVRKWNEDAKQHAPSFGALLHRTPRPEQAGQAGQGAAR